MAWRCPSCGKMVEDQSDACGSCGAHIPAGTRKQSGYEELRQAADKLVRTLDQAAREETITAELAEQRRAARLARGVPRLVEAWRLHRSRIKGPSSGQRPDLDRRWAYLYLSVAMFSAGALASFLYPDETWPDWLRENALYLSIGMLAVTAICWRRAVRGELAE